MSICQTSKTQYLVKCNHYIFEQGDQKLQITMDWENKLIDQVILEQL